MQQYLRRSHKVFRRNFFSKVRTAFTPKKRDFFHDLENQLITKTNELVEISDWSFPETTPISEEQIHQDDRSLIPTEFDLISYIRKLFLPEGEKPLLE